MIDIRFSSLFPLNKKNLNTNTFINFFGTIHSAQTIIINLVNCFFEHAITRNNSNLNCYKYNPFTYITLEKYTSNKFCRIIIDI